MRNDHRRDKLWSLISLPDFWQWYWYWFLMLVLELAFCIELDFWCGVWLFILVLVLIFGFSIGIDFMSWCCYWFLVSLFGFCCWCWLLVLFLVLTDTSDCQLWLLNSTFGIKVKIYRPYEGWYVNKFSIILWGEKKLIFFLSKLFHLFI